MRATLVAVSAASALGFSVRYPWFSGAGPFNFNFNLAQVPNVPLKNAAKPGVVMPAMGLGTGGYAGTPVGGSCTAYPGELAS